MRKNVKLGPLFRIIKTKLIKDGSSKAKQYILILAYNQKY